jgi:hypothetical protein
MMDRVTLNEGTKEHDVEAYLLPRIDKATRLPHQQLREAGSLAPSHLGYSWALQIYPFSFTMQLTNLTNS